jgi:hypothetical protein
MAKNQLKPATASLPVQPISGADEQAAHAVRLMDGLLADYLRDLTARGQSQTAQVLLPSIQEATRIVLAFIKSKAQG